MVSTPTYKKFTKPMLCILPCFCLIFLSMLSLNGQNLWTLLSQIHFDVQVQTFFNVCIEALTEPKLENRTGLTFNETKRIVVYQKDGQWDEEIVTIKVAGSANTLWNHWEIQFRHEDLPTERLENLRDYAFFVQPTCPGNFHHFFIDEFVPLFSVVVSNNRLKPGANNQILYRTPQLGNSGDRCNSRRTYEWFLRTLYINDFHDVFYHLPNNTCFRNAIFGNTPQLQRQRDVIDHVMKFYGVPLQNNVDTSELFVTIQSRIDRRIINVDELSSFVKEAGFSRVRIVDFNKKSLRDQLKIMSTTNVFIGIQGAGLQWASFMPEGSFLIELAWPNKHWKFYYYSFVRNFWIKWEGVEVQDVRLNWTSFERNVRNGVPVDETEKLNLIIKDPKDVSGDNIWKWADIVVQKSEILEILQNTFKSLQKLQ